MNAETAQKETNKTEEVKKEDSKQADPQTEKTSEPVAEKSPENTEKISEQGSAAVSNLKVLENIDVKLTVEVGNTEIKIKDLLRLNEGSVVELERLAGEPLDILANGTQIAKGEVVMVGEKFGIRFTEVSDPEELVQNL